jgi:hypothetical protein
VAAQEPDLPVGGLVGYNAELAYGVGAELELTDGPLGI